MYDRLTRDNECYFEVYQAFYLTQHYFYLQWHDRSTIRFGADVLSHVDVLLFGFFIDSFNVEDFINLGLKVVDFFMDEFFSCIDCHA